jgi:hypothetical protein
VKKYAKKYRDRDPEARKATTLRWRENNPISWKRSRFASHLKLEYGITVENWARAFHAQRGLCAGCREPMADPHTDHCHRTGKFRGLLCGSCNFAIGKARDNPRTLRRLAFYLERNR